MPRAPTSRTKIRELHDMIAGCLDQIDVIDDDVREVVKAHMPDLVGKLPPKTAKKKAAAARTWSHPKRPVKRTARGRPR